MASDKQHKEYDLLIIGGGAVGTSLAVALVQQGFSVALVDTYTPENRADPAKDNRILALAAGTQAALEKLDIWRYMQQSATKIEQIHVSNKGSFGASRLLASDFELDSLGFMITATDMQQGLNEAVAELEKSCQSTGVGNLDQYYPAKLVDFQQNLSSVTAVIKTADEATLELSANILVAADGTNSSIRKKLGIRTKQKHYQQQALVARIQLEQSHHFVAYERFIKDGAIALLPYQNNQCALIWSVNNRDADRLMVMDDQEFLQELQQVFGYRLGVFSGISKRFSYPLIETKAEQVYQDNIVLIGNSAQTLHPIAAQGFNLALRHVALLSDLLAKQDLAALESGAIVEILENYQKLQYTDTRNTLFFTNTLVHFFSDQSIGKSKILRGSLLAAFDLVPPIQRHLLKGVMKGS